MDEPELIEPTNEPLPVYLISTNKFLILNLLTLNVYSIWWMYKAWVVFRHKENIDVMPAARAIFGLLFMVSLFNRIKNFALECGYQKDFSPIALFLGILVANFIPSFLGLDEKYATLSLLAGVLFSAPNEALNFALLNSKEFKAEEEDGFNSRQVFLIIMGIIFWLLYLVTIFNVKK